MDSISFSTTDFLVTLGKSLNLSTAQLWEREAGVEDLVYLCNVDDHVCHRLEARCNTAP